MALPPERLRVKRSAADAPLDVLYFERPQKRMNTGEVVQQPETIQYHYKLKPIRPQRRSPSKSPVRSRPGIPTIGTTQPGEEVNYFQNLAAKKESEQKQLNKDGAAGRVPDQMLTSPSEPRWLYLDLNASARAGKRKRHDSETPLAVFVENKAAKIEGKGAPAATQQQEPSQPATPSRKRPNVKSTLSVEATLSRNISRQTLNEDFQKAAQKFADEELSQRKEAEELTRKITALSMAGGKEDVVMTDSEIDADYVYDTYVRCPVDVSPARNRVIPDGSEAGVGFLVLGGDDQEFWETFGEDEEFDEDAWNSDQDDENAENWFGADYPEDEVDSDDEYDEDPYRFRVNASDDEQFGDDSDGDESEKWSDDQVDEYSYASYKGKKTDQNLEEDFGDLGIHDE